MVELIWVRFNAEWKQEEKQQCVYHIMLRGINGQQILDDEKDREHRENTGNRPLCSEDREHKEPSPVFPAFPAFAGLSQLAWNWRGYAA